MTLLTMAHRAEDGVEGFVSVHGEAGRSVKILHVVRVGVRVRVRVRVGVGVGVGVRVRVRVMGARSRSCTWRTACNNNDRRYLGNQHTCTW